MGNFKIHFNKFGGATFFVVLTLLLLQSCIQSPAANRSSVKSANSTNSTTTTTKLPTFTEGNNFIQNGVSVSTSIVNLNMTFADFLQLRGKDVDSYIRTNGTQNVVCLTSRFQSANKVILLAAIPRSVYNFTTQTLEYYYNLAPGDATTNQSFCQKTGLINQLFAYYPTYTPKYNLAEVCPSGSCTASSYAGLGMEMYNSNGVAISAIATKQLIFNLTVTASTSDPVGATCTETSQCKSQGYDCCSLGQCVKDLALKPGVDTTSPNYLQALQDILNNPSNVYLYSQYYFICSSPVNTPTTPTSPTNPVSEATARLKRLADLYNCTTKTEGEYGVCTKTYTSAALNTFYAAGKDDRSFADTFTNINVDKQTLFGIEQVIYGDVVVFDYTLKDESQLYPNDYDDTSVRIEGAHNDDLASGTNVKVKVKPAAAVSNDLVIRYKIDASCTKINSTLAKCEKHYVQGQENAGDTVALHRRGRVTDHYPDSNVFKLPYYANTAKAITVEVDGITLKQDLDWQLNAGATSTIQFLPVSVLKVFKDQKVKISYFVDLGVNDVMSSKLTALGEIKTMCGCSDTTCSLAPVKNTSGVVTDYACVYPDPDPVEPPVSQKIFLSSKAVPVRYFDSLGVSQTSVSSGTSAQEGIAFKYRSDNLLNPSNVTDITNPTDPADTYTGFNEIYGSLSYTNSSAKPAYEVAVKKGNTYDIYVDRGSFSNCIQCGNDYYSQLNKLFPLAQFGGGAVPMLGQTNRTISNGIRADDMSFGRACMVPATMIPWTHNPESSNQTQRLNRMRAQHFMFANGYQRDWYGFDYGSVIGSFDGVKWFSIGSSRRIKAETSKMFIAVNGLFGDLTLESTYEVTVNDGLLNPVGANMNTSDYTSDGAQCQQFHACTTDNDCATTLGWDYACAPVTELNTSWPKFDDNAKEIPETSNSITQLTSILGTTSSAKRCVYRGRGSLCTPAYNAVNETTTFNKTKTSAFHACSANTYCQTLSTNGVSSAKFNNRIVRYGKVRTDSTVDSFGLAALIPGRPFAWNPIEVPRAETLKNLNANKSMALCLPGRDLDQDTFAEQNSMVPPAAAEYNGDKVLNMGMSFRKNTPTSAFRYLASCSIEDSTKNFYHSNGSFADTPQDMSNFADLKYDAGSQALSTNALDKFNAIFALKGINFGLFKKNSDIQNSVAYTENRCMRAPGASCYTDMDCGPSKIVSDKIKSLSVFDTTVTNLLNAYEVKFWQEALVCAQEVAKDDALYDPKNNRCCREIGNTISMPSADFTNKLDMTKVAGADYLMSDINRYSRSATMYKEVNTNSTTYPPLKTAIKDQCSNGAAGGCLSTSTLGLEYQWKTFAAMAEKTSCSGNWIRNFANGTNNHLWEPGNLQTFSTTMFRCMNWYPGDGGYTCTGDEDDPTCGIAQTSPNTPKARDVFAYLGKMELMGIPQIALESETFFSSATSEEGMSCKSNPSSRAFAYPDHPNPVLATGTYSPPLNLFAGTLSAKEYTDTTKGQMYSAVDNTNFNSGFKQIFKADEVVACMPAGTVMKASDSPSLCCTGWINPANLKCQLKDYIDLSVYTNRYVSSEAKKLSPTLIDNNGYVRDPAYVANLACERSMCASGAVAYGVLISRLKTPGQTSSTVTNYRFLEGSTTVDNEHGLLDLFAKGLKINTHAYCIPAALASSTTAANDLTIVTCGQ